MMILWQKLKRLQRDIRSFSKPLTDLQPRLLVARANMKNAQNDLNDNRMNNTLIEKIKGLTKEVIELNETEGKILQQKAKIQWLKWEMLTTLIYMLTSKPNIILIACIT